MLVILVLQDQLVNREPKVQLARKVFLDSMGNLGPEEFQDLLDPGEIQGTREQM